MGNHDPYSDDAPSWPGFTPIVANAQIGYTQLSPSLRCIFLEKDKGSNHEVLAAGSVVGRGWVDTGTMERPARD
jgi:hypothetical protein